jgi:hypothetical protein
MMTCRTNIIVVTKLLDLGIRRMKSHKHRVEIDF